MPNTTTKIASVTLTSATQLINLTSIPNTYTSLLLKATTRSSVSGGAFSTVYVNFNSDYNTLYSITYMQGLAGSVFTGRTSNQGGAAATITNTSSATANYWSNNEILIPNYTATTSKQAIVWNASPTNTSNYECWQAALLYRGTSAVSSIQLDSFTSGINFVVGSTFTLYGIKNT